LIFAFDLATRLVVRYAQKMVLAWKGRRKAYAICTELAKELRAISSDGSETG
jgi:hypothetical protein